MEEVLHARMRQEPSFVEAEAQIELLEEVLRALRQGLVEGGTSGPESDALVWNTAHKLRVIKSIAARLRSSEQRLSSWHEGRGEYDKSYARVFIQRRQRRLTVLERQVDDLYRDEVAARVMELSRPKPRISLLPDDSWRFD